MATLGKVTPHLGHLNPSSGYSQGVPECFLGASNGEGTWKCSGLGVVIGVSLLTGFHPNISGGSTPVNKDPVRLQEAPRCRSHPEGGLPPSGNMPDRPTPTTLLVLAYHPG